MSLLSFYTVYINDFKLVIPCYLLRELLLEDVVVLGPDLLHPLLAHPVCDHDHLLQSEDRLLAVLVPSGGGPGPHGAAGACHGHRVHVHHRFRGARGRHGRRGVAIMMRRGRTGGRGGTSRAAMELTPPLETFDLIAEVVGDLLRGEGGLPEHGGRLLDLLGGAVRAADVRGAPPPLLWSVGGVEGVKIQASLQSNASHHAGVLLQIITTLSETEYKFKHVDLLESL